MQVALFLREHVCLNLQVYQWFQEVITVQLEADIIVKMPMRKQLQVLVCQADTLCNLKTRLITFFAIKLTYRVAQVNLRFLQLCCYRPRLLDDIVTTFPHSASFYFHSPIVKCISSTFKSMFSLLFVMTFASSALVLSYCNDRRYITFYIHKAQNVYIWFQFYIS